MLHSLGKTLGLVRCCIDCGTEELVRVDNKSERCRRCACSLSLAKGRRARYARTPANIEICEHCKKTFFAGIGRGQRFCGVACKNVASNVERECKQCGGSFLIFKSRLSDKTNASGNFCSRPCYDAFLCTGVGKFNRGPYWRAARREAIRLNPFCAMCGRLHDLHVHHIVPYRILPSNAQENLIPLCRRDHKRVEHFFLGLEPLERGLSPQDMLFFRRYSLVEQQNLTRFRLAGLIQEMRREKEAAFHG